MGLSCRITTELLVRSARKLVVRRCADELPALPLLRVAVHSSVHSPMPDALETCDSDPRRTKERGERPSLRRRE